MGLYSSQPTHGRHSPSENWQSSDSMPRRMSWWSVRLAWQRHGYLMAEDKREHINNKQGTTKCSIWSTSHVHIDMLLPSGKTHLCTKLNGRTFHSVKWYNRKYCTWLCTGPLWSTYLKLVGCRFHSSKNQAKQMQGKTWPWAGQENDTTLQPMPQKHAVGNMAQLAKWPLPWELIPTWEQGPLQEHSDTNCYPA